jgi:hypothetical protein
MSNIKRFHRGCALQSPNPNKAPTFKHQPMPARRNVGKAMRLGLEVWNLEFGISLEFGVWSLVFARGV